MNAPRSWCSLRAKMSLVVFIALVVVLTTTSYMRYVSYQRFLAENVGSTMADSGDIIANHLADYRRSRLILSAGSITVILVIVNLMLKRIVLKHLHEFLRVVNRISQGHLDERVPVGSRDEIADLAEAFNLMADGIQERDRLEQSVKEHAQEMQAQAERLSALNALAATVSQSLDLKEVLNIALDKVLELMRSRAGWIVLRSEQHQGLDLITSRGLPESVARQHGHCPWDRCMCTAVLALGRPEIFRMSSDCACPATSYFREAGLAFRACVPLVSKDRILGVMSLVGDESSTGEPLSEGTLELLTAVGRQIGIAIENATLYEELRRKEVIRRQLLKRVISVQEEERRRIARELHDQTGQPLTSLLLTLKILEEANSPSQVRAFIGDLRDTASHILEQVHDLALELRPSVLDDLGLLAALRHYVREYQDRYRLPADLQIMGLDQKRLTPEVETALYRIAQEALTNAAKHADAEGVSVVLENRGQSVILVVEDDGKGFDVAALMGSYPNQKNLGLHGMRERASLVGGTLTVESSEGAGTAIFVEIPLVLGEEN